MRMRRTALAFAALACLAHERARAGEYPTRPVSVVVGFSAGTAADLTVRVVGQRMGAKLGQQIVVENRTGAGSSLAAEFVARARNDGYTLLVASPANPINAAVYPKLKFDFAQSLVPIVRLTTTPSILVVHPSLGVKTVKEDTWRLYAYQLGISTSEEARARPVARSRTERTAPGCGRQAGRSSPVGFPHKARAPS